MKISELRLSARKIKQIEYFVSRNELYIKDFGSILYENLVKN